jgi:hypothetical protein
MNQVYIFQTELDYEGGVGPIVVVDHSKFLCR